MALSIAQKLPNGVTVSYFRISTVIVDRKLNTVTIYVDAFLDQENRAAKSLPVTNYSYSAVDFYDALDKMPILQSAYGYLKTISGFEGAEDT